jgi:hypothetical protein
MPWFKGKVNVFHMSEQSSVDPRAANDPYNKEPRMLPSIDPSSVLGKAMREAIGRLRFANVDPAIQRMAQNILEGKNGPQDLLSLPELRRFDQQIAGEIRNQFGSLSEEEREGLFQRNGDR